MVRCLALTETLSPMVTVSLTVLSFEYRREAQTCPAELSTGLVAARRVHVAKRTDTSLLSRFLSVMVGWVAPSAHVADSYRSGGGQGVAGTLPERRLCLYVRLIML